MLVARQDAPSRAILDQPNSVAIDPVGNVWVGFGKSSAIARFNSPATATSSHFGTCAQFVQQAATVAGTHAGSGLAFVGHDLWGATLEIMFVIKNADTVCLVGQNPACGSANGNSPDHTRQLAGATSIASDQVYPPTNGNNLYIGDANSVAWVGNVVAGSAGQTLAPTYVATSIGLGNVGAVAVDGTDPANLVLYAGDDPSGAGTAGAGRIFQTIQTAAAPGAPGALLPAALLPAQLSQALRITPRIPSRSMQATRRQTARNPRLQPRLLRPSAICQS